MVNASDKLVLRDLASKVAEIAALPVQEEKRALWRSLNGLQMQRPMVMIDQVCWNEMAQGDELETKCQEAECRSYEIGLRRILYQWNHFPVDMVVEPFLNVPKAVRNTGFGVQVREETASIDPTSDVVGHIYRNQFETEQDLEKIQMPRICHDEAETRRRMDNAQEIFGGIIEFRESGVDPYLSLWDPISTWLGAEDALYYLIDRPDYIHRLVSRLTDGYLTMLDQLEDQGLLCQPQSLIHCTGAYTDELPAEGFDPEKPRLKDLWMFGLAQVFSSVSPSMFDEFEVQYASKICERFGLVYYGCCDPLDGKMDEVRKIPNVRKVSMSPWVNVERGAEAIGKDYVFSRKPSPAFLATDVFDEEAVRADLVKTLDSCRRHDCALEFILKDISTVRYEPQRLSRWCEVAMDVAQG